MWAFISLLPANEVTNSKVSVFFLITYLCLTQLINTSWQVGEDTLSKVF